ncbi:MAG: sulfite exporter TauE/SafE family protein [Chitinophagaceae bacterium]
MDNIPLLIMIGFVVGTLGTLIGAGGGFILVPILLFAYPGLKPEVITSISMAIVACNALSGTVAYAGAGRIDYRAGIWFAILTIPGSVLGALATKYIPKSLFSILFGILLIILAAYLLLKKEKKLIETSSTVLKTGWKQHSFTDNTGEAYSYTYNQSLGLVISFIVGFISPILGIGGGIIHVPALTNWLRFPVHIATATSHFVLLIMSLVTVMVHLYEGNYNDSLVIRLVIFLGIGVIAGAQLGAYLSNAIKGNVIIKALGLSLGLVGLRMLILYL